MPFFMEADKAARIILARVDRNVGLIAFPWPMRFASWLLSVCPWRLAEFVSALLPEKNADAAILTQIMAESITLTSIAGVAGLMLGVWILALVDTIQKAQPPTNEGFSMQSPQIPFSIAISAMLVIIIGGVWAGWMPAKRAMKIKAIEALREE